MIARFVELNTWQVSSEYYIFPETNTNNADTQRSSRQRWKKRKRQKINIIFFLQYLAGNRNSILGGYHTKE